jgi:hypothetical protein
VESGVVLVIRRATLAISIVLLLVSILYLAFGWAGSWNHQTVGETVLYWAGIFYLETSLSLVMIALLIFLALAVHWMLYRRRSYGVRGLAVLLALAAAPLACAASFPSGLVRIYHRDSARLGEHMYHLALRMAMDGDNVYILYECDSLGLICRSVAVGVYPLPTEIAVSTDLNVDPATNTVEVQIAHETVYTYSP